MSVVVSQPTQPPHMGPMDHSKQESARKEGMSTPFQNSHCNGAARFLCRASEHWYHKTMYQNVIVIALPELTDTD